MLDHSRIKSPINPKPKAFGLNFLVGRTIKVWPAHLDRSSLAPLTGLEAGEDIAMTRSRTARRYHAAAIGTNSRLGDSRQLPSD